MNKISYYLMFDDCRCEIKYTMQRVVAWTDF